jgi:hypothetical protein
MPMQSPGLVALDHHLTIRRRLAWHGLGNAWYMSNNQPSSRNNNRNHALRRGVATVAGGTLVIGAGAAVGVLAASMQSDWQVQAAAKAQAKSDANPSLVGDVPVRHPVERDEIEEEHVEGAPVVVYRQAPGSTSQAGSSGSSGSSGTSSGSSSGGTSTRTTVTPQQQAPARSSNSGGSSSTSKGS